MQTRPLEPGPGRLRAIRRAVTRAAGILVWRAHGQGQFYTLAQVQASVAGVVPEWHPWILAMFAARPDFEAWFAMRDTPGSYEQLRAALSSPAFAGSVEQTPTACSQRPWEGDADDLGWLAMLAVREVLS